MCSRMGRKGKVERVCAEERHNGVPTLLWHKQRSCKDQARYGTVTLRVRA